MEEREVGLVVYVGDEVVFVRQEDGTLLKVGVSEVRVKREEAGLTVIANEPSIREQLSPGERRGMLAMLVRISGMRESALRGAGLLEGDQEPGTAVEIARYITDAGWWRTREEFEAEWDLEAGYRGWTEAEMAEAKAGPLFPWPAVNEVGDG